MDLHKLILFIPILVLAAACAPEGGSFQVAQQKVDSQETAGDRTLGDVVEVHPKLTTVPVSQTPPHEDGPEIVVTAPRKAKPAAPVAQGQGPRPTTSHSAPLIPAWAQKSQSQTWTQMTVKALREIGHELVTTEIQDATDFCPGYAKLLQPAREAVWVQLISSMVHYESDFKPWEAFVERFRGRNNKFVVSRGLLQISSGSANSYGCNIQKEADLEDPETNLRCGVRIINSLVTKYHAIHGLQSSPSDQHNPWRGAARYWNVLRSVRIDTQIRAAVRALPMCRA